jgi:hypothetical protein
VVAELIQPGSIAKESGSTTTSESVALAISGNDKLSVLSDKLLQHLGVPGVVTFKSVDTQQTMYRKQTAQFYGLKSGSTVHAKVHLIRSCARGSSVDASGLSAAAASGTLNGASSKKSLGRSVTLMVRRPTGETIAVQTYRKQPLQAALDQFVSKLSGSSAKPSPSATTEWRFKFDGDFLNLQRDTPESLDMDDDDLIDAVEK